MTLEYINDVFFDLDHTLWDFDKNSALTFDKIFKLNKIDLNLKTFLNYYEPLNLKYWKLYREEKIEKQSLRFNRLNEAFLAMHQKIDADLIFKLSNEYITHLPDFNHLFANTLEVLNYLNTKYNLHIITNGFHEIQNKKLKNANILHYFKTVTNAETVGVKKPNPEIFNYALSFANAKASKSIMIGDSLEADIMGAKNVGMDAIFFNVNNIQVNDDVKQVGNLIDLKHYL